MARIIVKKGDVFSVHIDEKHKKYFQYVMDDETQLSSNIIRVYKERYLNNETPELINITEGEIDFYAHCILKLGIQLGCWEKEGNVADIGSIDVVFRDTSDYGRKEGEAPILVSSKWYVWRPNDPDFTRVGMLTGENRNAEIGLIINPHSIVYRMKNGNYDMPFYPKFE